MATIMGARQSPPSASATEETMSNVRPSAGRTTKGARGASAASKPVKASKTKTPNGANSDHRKEQNRIASRNYREKRKHKLALLQQILHEPSASEGASAAKAASGSASTPAAAPAFSTAAAAASVAQDVDTLGGILPDFQPILSGLMPANMLAPDLDGSPATSTPSISLVAPPPSSSSTVPIPTQAAEPLDEFAAWAASNLPAAVAANSPRSQRMACPSSASASGSRSGSGSGSAPRSTSTSTTIPALSSSSAAATASDLLDMPMLQPWLIPFSSDQNIFTPFLTNTTLNNTVTANTSSASTSTGGRAHHPPPATVTEVVDLDETFDPAIEVDQFMSDSQQQNANSDNLFSDLMMRADFSTSYFATQSYQNLQGTFGSSTPGAAAAVGSSIPLPFASPSPNSNSNSSNHSQSRPHTTTLPFRPSPRPFFQTLASPSDTTGGNSSGGPPPNFLPYTLASPKATGDMAREPSRKTRKKNKPVVRAMLQYVQTLSPHQKRLILQALLDGEGGAPGEDGVDDNDNEMGDNDDDERIEEIDNGEDDSDGSNGGRSNKSAGSGGAADKVAAKKAAFISRREDRRRQVVARWNSGRFAAENGGDQVTGFSFSSSASSSSSSSGSPSSGASTIEATNFASMALSGFDGPNGLTGPIHHGQPPNGIYGANFGAEPGARPYFPVPLMVMNLQCRRMGFRAVVLENCLACGLVNPDLMFDEAACYDEQLEPVSPFALNADEARAVVLQGAGRIAAVVAAVRQSLARAGKTPPRDLQPVDAQILVAHHPYIDIIPFKGFRARVLALLAEMELAEEVAAAVQKNNNADGVVDTPSSGGRGGGNGNGNETPCLLDEDELCYDMNVAEGLVCWGSQMGNAGAGMSAQAKRDSDSSRDMRACLPWDMRSWEPQVWFLKKYWFLVGGWDDDMWRNCRWWHSMRGDDLDYSVFASPGY